MNISILQICHVIFVDIVVFFNFFIFFNFWLAVKYKKEIFIDCKIKEELKPKFNN